MPLMSPSQMTVLEMVAELVASGLNREDLKGKRRTELRRQVNALRRAYGTKTNKPPSKPAEEDHENPPTPATKPSKAKPEPTKTAKKIVTSTQPINTKVDPTHPEWTQYVIGLMGEDELVEDHPTIDGLRRVASMLIGPIVSKTSDLVDPPRPDNGMRACVRVRVIYHGNTGPVTHDGLADVCEENCEPAFARFLTSSAETRAEARCHRSALMLRRVVAAEELPGSISTGDDKTKATPGFISGLKLMCTKFHLSPAKILASIGITSPLEHVTAGQSKAFLERLNEIRAMDPIPEEFVVQS